MHAYDFYLLKINALHFGKSSTIRTFWYALHGALGDADYNPRAERSGVICVLMIQQALAACREHRACNCHRSTH